MKTRIMNERGAFLVFVTLAFVLLGLFVGVAIDGARGYLLKARLARVVDAATLAAAKALRGQIGFQDEAIQAACEAFLMNGIKVAINAEDGSCKGTGGSNFTLDIKFVDNAVSGGSAVRFVQITGTASIPTTFIRLAKLVASGNFDTLTVSAFAEGGPERPIDLMLVLDRSGSMNATDGSGTTTKIDALKITVKEFLTNTFGPDDKIGMTSFAFRGCGDGNGNEFTGPAPDCQPDIAISTSSINNIINVVNKFNALGGTNTMEALLMAKQQMDIAVADDSRKRNRKVVLLVTDGQPTFMRRFTDADCERTPRTNSPLPAGSFDDGCLFGVRSKNFSVMLRNTLAKPAELNDIGAVPGCDGPCLYKDAIAGTRDTVRGALSVANQIRALDADGDGKGDVVIFAIGIGTPLVDDPQSSLDANAKCLLARIANDPSTISECNGVFRTTADEDTHADLKENWPCGGGPCIDATQLQGQVFTVDLKGNVAEQLRIIFDTIAALLKLRLTV